MLYAFGVGMTVVANTESVVRQRSFIMPK
jgi:hypothetical protein